MSIGKTWSTQVPTSSTRHSQRKRFFMKNNAFTLIELLVVVAIMVLLVALLLPALDRTRYQAHTAQCVSDKRQLMMGANETAITYKQYPYDTTSNYFMQPNDHASSAIDRMKNQFAVPYSVWICAVDWPSVVDRNQLVSDAVAAGYSNGNKAMAVTPLVSDWIERGPPPYGMYYANVDTAGILSTNFLGEIPTKVVFSDPKSVPSPGTGTGSHYYNGISMLSVVACLDGHVEARPISQTRNVFGGWNIGY